jgi:hypothetical protein
MSMAALVQPAMAGAGPGSETLSASASGLDSVKIRIHASDEEWKVIGPCLVAVITARQTANYSLSDSSRTAAQSGAGRNGRRGRGAGAGGDSFESLDSGFAGSVGRGGRGGGGSGGASTAAGPVGGTTSGAPAVATPGTLVADNPVALALVELENALANTNTPPQEIEERVATVRGAKEKAKADLALAQKKLRRLLTPSQEAVLASLGYLD